ncbi:MAG: hypothetical protein V7647_1364, partial [Acidobacteriota bacterium]
GRRLVGSLPLEEFSRAIDAELTAISPDRTVPPLPRTESPRSAAAIEPSATDNPKSPQTVSLLWFSDVQSSLTPQAAELVHNLVEEYGGKVKLTFKHRPLELHPQAMLAHEALAAAEAQGKFWEMHAIILGHPQAATRDNLVSDARQLSMNVEAFQAALDTHGFRSIVDADLAEARWRDVRGSPTFFINSKRIDGIQPLEMFRQMIDQELTAVATK